MTMSYLAHLRDVLGFDRSEHIPFTKHYHVRCSSCEALSINGVPCHESRCPNQSHECRECGCTIPASESCDCLNPVED
jgi:hypothetical protein